MILPKIFPYKMGSKSATALAKSLQCLKVYPDRHYHPRNNHLIINWGNSIEPKWYENTKDFLNHPAHVKVFTNKLLFLRSMLAKFRNFGLKDAIMDFTVSPTPQHFLKYPIYCRTLLASHSGKGIIIVNEGDNIPPAQLYTEKLPIGEEYRLHFFRDYDNMILSEKPETNYSFHADSLKYSNHLFHTQQKKKMTTEKLAELGFTFNENVKSYENGWVFAINDIVPIKNVILQEIKMLARNIPLDFFAIDVNIDKNGNWQVIEINTAPGLEGTTLEKYTQEFNNLLNYLNS